MYPCLFLAVYFYMYFIYFPIVRYWSSELRAFWWQKETGGHGRNGPSTDLLINYLRYSMIFYERHSKGSQHRSHSSATTGSVLISVYMALSRQWAADTAQLCGGRPHPSYILPLPSQCLGWYQLIVHGDIGTCVWATCPELLPQGGMAGTRTCDLLIDSQMQ